MERMMAMLKDFAKAAKPDDKEIKKEKDKVQEK